MYFICHPALLRSYMNEHCISYLYDAKLPYQYKLILNLNMLSIKQFKILKYLTEIF